MLFSRSHRYKSPKQVPDIKKSLIGQHMKVHDMDFEVYEKDNVLQVVPHAEQDNSLKTLPITQVELKANGAETQVTIRSRMREIDSGGPFLIVIFCCFMLIAGVLFFLFGEEQYLSFTYTLIGISILIFAVFWTRMEMGYFDYVKKIRDHIKHQISAHH